MAGPNHPLVSLGKLSHAEFLARHWQREPLVLRGLVEPDVCPLGPNELAGLACEAEVTARLVLESGGDHPWELHHGPFEAAELEALPERGWSLLVEDADRHVPELADLRDRFRFVPEWRLDDVMVSLAPDGGSVGAHVDSYDVFLVQAHGRRRWHYGPVTDPEDLLDGADVRVLRAFRPEHEVELGPGDALYLPPGVGHHGIAVGMSMTLSIGFLAPTARELALGFAEHALGGPEGEARYADPGLVPPAHPAQLREDDLARVRALVRTLALDDEAIDAWFGHFATRLGESVPVDPEGLPADAAELHDALEQGLVLRRAEESRMVYRPIAGGMALFVNGERVPVGSDATSLVPIVTARRELLAEDLPHLAERPDCTALLLGLLQRGVLYFV